MKKRSAMTTLGCFVIIAGVVTSALSMSTKRIVVPERNAEDAARMITAMIVAGRGVVAKHQSLINDAAKGDKHFTPEYVADLMEKSFREMTKTSVDEIESPVVRQALRATLEASKEAVRNNQRRINQPGKAFKGFIPAVYGRITGNILKGKTGIAVKQTTFKFRNAYNQPDDFEASVLRRFEETKPSVGYGERVGDVYRYLQPIYIKKACLSCHGDPKGELDIAGKVKEGYKIGDLRGAISVSIPLE